MIVAQGGAAYIAQYARHGGACIEACVHTYRRRCPDVVEQYYKSLQQLGVYMGTSVLVSHLKSVQRQRQRQPVQRDAMRNGGATHAFGGERRRAHTCRTILSKYAIISFSRK